MSATEAQIAEFTKQRDAIYNKFQHNLDLHTTGAVPIKVFADNVITHGGFLIAYRFEDQQANILQEFSDGLRLKVPGTLPGVIVYGRTNGHVTVGDYDVGDGFTSRYTRDKAYKVTDKLAESIEGVLKHLDPVEIRFVGWDANANTVISPGYANDAFVDNQVVIDDAIRSAFDKANDPVFDASKLRKGVMSHTTAARFTKKYSPDELQKEGFFEYMEDEQMHGLDYGVLNTIDIASFTMMKGERGFILVPHYRIILQPELKKVIRIDDEIRMLRENDTY